MMGDDLMLFEALGYCAFEDLRDQFTAWRGFWRVDGMRNAMK